MPTDPFKAQKAKNEKQKCVFKWARQASVPTYKSVFTALVCLVAFQTSPAVAFPDSVSNLPLPSGRRGPGAESAAVRAPRRLRGDFIMLGAGPRAPLPPPCPALPGSPAHALSAPGSA
jgi:hypothetical protein